MVDVADKAETSRVAVASGVVRLQPGTVQLLRDGAVPKGDVLAAARIAGIMAAKRTSDLIPLCHPLAITRINIDLTIVECGVEIAAEVGITGKTGVEIEALTAVSVAALTIYDMVKAAERGVEIRAVRLEEKQGGRSGHWRRGGRGSKTG
jgi:cyclic pyranopterin phosphate synthase